MRTKPLCDPEKQAERLKWSRARRKSRWQVETPNGTSFRQLKRACAFGYSPAVRVQNPTDYLSGYQRRRLVTTHQEAA